MKKVLTIRFEIITDNEKPKPTKVAPKKYLLSEGCLLAGLPETFQCHL